MKKSTLAASLALSAALMGSQFMAAMAESTNNSFGFSEVSNTPMQVAEHKCGSGSCGGKEHKEGEHKCGSDKDHKDGEHKCGSKDHKEGEHKCGSGSCGSKGH